MNLKYRSDIDGLRALAVVSVIIYHLNYHWLHGGFIGVDIFFVISGYLITKIIYADIINEQFSFKHFYQRRINRILPAFFFIMFISGFFAWYILVPDEFMLFLKSLKTTTYFWENMFFAQNTGGYWDIAAEQMPLLHTWSLAVEEQFYILLPFLLLFLYGVQFKTKSKLFAFNKTSILITLIIIALISFYLAQISPILSKLTKYNYYSLLTGRAGELLIGSIIGMISVNSKQLHIKNAFIIKNILSLIGFIALILSIAFISKKKLFPSFWALIPTIGAVLVIFFYDKRTIVAKFLSLKPIVFIGKISFSLYLWHWPIIVLTKKYLFIDNFENAWQYSFVIFSTIILSIITYYLIETPCRKNKKSFKFSLIFYYLLPAVVIVGVYKVQKQTQFLNFRYEKRLELYKLQKEFLNPESHFCHNKIDGNCIFGDISREPKILLIGDSHAGHYSPYLDEAGKMYGFSVQIVTVGSCQFSKIQMQKKLINDDRIEMCNNGKSYVNDNIKNKKVVFVAFRNNLFVFSENENKFYLSIESLKEIINNNFGAKFISFTQVPEINKVNYEKFVNNFMFGKKTNDIDYLSGNEKEANSFMIKELKNKVIFMNPINDLNPKSKQNWPIYNGLIAYKDDNHLNEYVTRQWSQEVLPKQKEFWEGILKIVNEE